MVSSVWPRVGEVCRFFFVGDYVLVARVRRSGSTPKLLMTWTGPWRVLVAQRSHVYGVQNIVSGEDRDVHVTQMRFYADAALEMTAELKEVFQHASRKEGLKWQQSWIWRLWRKDLDLRWK